MRNTRWRREHRRQLTGKLYYSAPTIDTPEPGRRRRRTFDPAFKAELVAACQHPDVSAAAIALDHGR